MVTSFHLLPAVILLHLTGRLLPPPPPASSLLGRFSPAQAELYEAVLEVQRSCLSLCSPGVSLDHIYSSMLALVGRQLRRLGVVKAATSDADVLKVNAEKEEIIVAG